MQNRPFGIDAFTKNIIIVFAGTSLANFLNLLYQLLIAHKLSTQEFAAFNSLLALFTIFSAPLGTLTVAVAKYSAGFNAHNEPAKIKFFISDLFKKGSVLAIATFFIFLFFSIKTLDALKIPSLASGYILALLLASMWLVSIFTGAIQGLERFNWMTSVMVGAGILKLIAAFILILLGYSIAGALGAFLIVNILMIVVFYLPLKQFISLKAERQDINYKEILTFLLPVAITYFCYYALVSFDMVLVKYYFSQSDSGLYSLAQMLGKIFLFLPGAISIVLLPRASGLHAKNMDTLQTLKKSLLYAGILCVIACLGYNLLPSFTLKVLTGKSYLESIFLGRLFSLSMSFFALLLVMITYFLSKKDLRFIKYLAFFTVLQFLAIALFHQSLVQVQVIMCINAILLFIIHLALLKRR